MEQSQYNFLFSFIWNIANDVLVNAFNKGDYKKVILPMLVLRRIDVLLEPTKDAVIQMKEQLDNKSFQNAINERVFQQVAGGAKPPRNVAATISENRAVAN